MVLKEIQHIDSGRKKLREFGFLVGGVLIVLGILFWGRGKPFFPFLLVPGVLLAGAGGIAPDVLKPLQKVWMALAILMGWVMTRLLLSVLFYGAITPLAFFLRLTGKDLLDLRLDPKASSYWKIRAQTPAVPGDYEKQY